MTTNEFNEFVGLVSINESSVCELDESQTVDLLEGDTLVEAYTNILSGIVNISCDLLTSEYYYQTVIKLNNNVVTYTMSTNKQASNILLAVIVLSKIIKWEVSELLNYLLNTKTKCAAVIKEAIADWRN